MKAVRLFEGYDSAGYPTELAEGANGAWFWRTYEFNGYAKAWSKWATYNKTPDFPEKILNNTECANAPLYLPVDVGTVVNWGFALLRLVGGVPKVRLPN